MRILFIGSGTNPPPFISSQLSFIENSGCQIIRPFDRDKGRLVKDAILALSLHTRRSIRLISFSKKFANGFVERSKWFIRNSIIVRHNSIDVIHFQWPLHAIKYRWLFEWYGSVPSFLSMRGRQVNFLPFISRDESFIRQYREIIEHVDMLHVVSSKMVKKIKKINPNIEHKYYVASSGVDTRYFSTKKDRQYNPLRIVSVGALIWRKGHIYLIKAVHRLIDEGYDIKLKIIGDGPLKNLLHKYIQDNSLGDCIELLGYKDRDFIKKTYNESGIFVLPSLSEGLCNALVEAMSMSLPVIIAESESSEAVEDSSNGFIVSRRDYVEIYKRILFFINNDSVMKEFGRKSRELAKKRYCSTRNNSLMLEQYKKVIRKDT